jgi:murein DD-endopeptidase MepM/ murein hydrolase activator NlpD
LISRSRFLFALVAIALLAGVLGGPTVAVAATKGSGGWYWPTGSENFGGMSGYWVHRSNNNSWHMAQDMRLPQGRPVYAIADGTVAESKGEAGYGGVLVVWHKTGDGQKFLAVYGHVIRGNFPKGAKVRAGQVIGKANSANHVHFGIHPGDAYPPDRNPFRGHTYDPKQTYGWVNPVKFLREHPAYLPYKAPALPLVTTVSTSATPTVLGVADGSVYWMQPAADADESPTVFARPISSGETTRLAEEAVLPALDTTRYLATSTGVSFSLFDRMPVLASAYSTLNPRWGQPVAFTGTLKSAAGKPFSGAKVCIERSLSGKTWGTVATGITGLDGAFSVGYVPTRSYVLRLRFTPPASFATTCTPKLKVSPMPGVHPPDSAKQAGPAQPVTLSGKLDLRHAAGTRSVELRIMTLGPTGWTDVITTWTANANSGSGTRYARKLKLAPGPYRVYASIPGDTIHAAEKTGWVTFRVK